MLARTWALSRSFFAARRGRFPIMFLRISTMRVHLHWHAYYILFLGGSAEDHATSDCYWLGRQTLSCRPACDRAFQGSEHAIIRLLGDCGRIRTSLHCTIAAKPIHSHGLLAPLTLLNTVEMRPFGNSVSLPVTTSHFDSQTRRSTFLHLHPPCPVLSSHSSSVLLAAGLLDDANIRFLSAILARAYVARR